MSGSALTSLQLFLYYKLLGISVRMLCSIEKTLRLGTTGAKECRLKGSLKGSVLDSLFI